MPIKTDKNLKLYYSIKEVAEMLNLNESTLRYWERKFPQLSPKTGANKVRQYTEKDIELLKQINSLVRVRGFHLASARKMLAENKQGVDKSAEMIDRLISVRDELKNLKKQLDSLV